MTTTTRAAGLAETLVTVESVDVLLRTDWREINQRSIDGETITWYWDPAENRHKVTVEGGESTRLWTNLNAEQALDYYDHPFCR